jgi:hypothetical protein
MLLNHRISSSFFAGEGFSFGGCLSPFSCGIGGTERSGAGAGVGTPLHGAALGFGMK